jgi:arylsulfatase A-like enzyme
MKIYKTIWCRFLLVAACALATTGHAATEDRPNIIYILADDLGWGDISALGQEILSTPNIDRLRDEGMLFTQHYSGSAVCGPSRGVLMSGQHTGNAAIRGNKFIPGVGIAPLDPDVPTLPETIKIGTDYTTVLFGRWHCGGELSDQMPHQRGFDTHWGKLSADFPNLVGVMIDPLWDENGKHVPYSVYSAMNMEAIYENGQLADLTEQQMAQRPINMDEQVTLRAIDYIDRTRDQPYLMYVAYSLPHAPMEYHEKYPVYDLEWPEPERAFATMLAALDDYVGRIVDAVDAAGMRERTVIMFSSDNGAHAEGRDVNFFNSTGPFRDFKRAFYEGGFHVPFIVRWPGVVPPGSTSNHISAFWDVMPTLCDIAGAPIPSHTDGISFLPELRGEPQPKHEYLYWEFNENSGSSPRLTRANTNYKQAVRWNNWKGVYRIDPDRFELYNLEDDIGETTNLATKHPEIVEQMREFMAASHTPNATFPLLKSERMEDQ